MPGTSERQILDLAKLFLSADQIKLSFIQIIVNIRQFCGFKKPFFSFFSDYKPIGPAALLTRTDRQSAQYIIIAMFVHM